LRHAHAALSDIDSEGSQGAPGCSLNGGSIGASFFPPAGSGQPAPNPAEVSVLDVENFTFFLLNLRGFVSHSAELEHVLEFLDFPTFVCLNETLLPGEKALREINLSGYSLISRRDRPDCSGWGGIALFCRRGFEEHIVHVGDSACAERSWHILHTDRGPVAVALWYRPPRASEIDTIRSLEAEMGMHCKDCVGRVILGDLNVHEKSWLKHSSGTSVEGRELHGLCASHGLAQFVDKPTREQYLLDLVLSDLGPLVKTKVVPGIADHSGVFCTLRFPVPEASVVHRKVFLYSKANWSKLRRAIRDTDWCKILVPGDADGSAERFEEHLLRIIQEHIPSKIIADDKASHAWLDDDCRRLIRRKRAAAGTDDFAAKRDECTAGLLHAYETYLKRIRAKLAGLEPSSREWWKISRSLMSLGSSSDVIPPLQRDDDTWAKSASEKASLLAETFAGKAELDDEERNDFTMKIMRRPVSDKQFVPIRRRYARSVLKKLDENSGTGPDGISARVFRRCCDDLVAPVTELARIVFNQGRWPDSWRLHWIHPIYKKKSRADPRNYRGVHLTAQISKIVERIVGKAFLPEVHRSVLFGDRQYAYSARRSHKDALAANVCNWLRMLENGELVGLYCSDVSGAFDRVRRTRMLQKLGSCGLPPPVARFLASWLEDRRSSVVVGGVASEERVLSNSVFQGTVFGPPLWNLFYGDSILAVRPLSFIEVIFADDFNCWKPFARGSDVGNILNECRECQTALHRWGRANSVKFDAGKESFHVLHRSQGFGDDFRLLGLEFDVSLRMVGALAIIGREAGWRLQAVLRPRRFFTTRQTMNLYKSQVLSFIESGTPGYYHASPSALAPVDRVQSRLLRELGITQEAALLEFSLAPLRSRRDIAMLGFLHQIVLGDVSRQIAELFPFQDPADLHQIPTRLQVRRHSHQFVEPRLRTDVLKRSAFHLTAVYNWLPQSVVDAKSTKVFQRKLQFALKQAVLQGVVGWEYFFSPWSRPVNAFQFQAFFK